VKAVSPQQSVLPREQGNVPAPESQPFPPVGIPSTALSPHTPCAVACTACDAHPRRERKFETCCKCPRKQSRVNYGLTAWRGGGCIVHDQRQPHSGGSNSMPKPSLATPLVEGGFHHMVTMRLRWLLLCMVVFIGIFALDLLIRRPSYELCQPAHDKGGVISEPDSAGSPGGLSSLRLHRDKARTVVPRSELWTVHRV
jgi:hypothetical protein